MLKDDKFICSWMDAVQARGRHKPVEPRRDLPAPEPERIEFEQEAQRRGWDLTRRGNPNTGLLTYKTWAVECGWQMWLARSKRNNDG